MTGMTENSITLSWTVSGDEVERYEVDWGAGSESLSGTQNNYTIEGLGDGETYTITLTASNVAGSITNDVTASTTAG